MARTKVPRTPKKKQTSLGKVKTSAVTPKVASDQKLRTTATGKSRSARRAARPAAGKKTPVVVSKKKSSEAIEIESDEEYEVKQILDSRMKVGGGAQEYLIQWKGYGKDDSTWEPASSLENCPELLKEYLGKLNEKGVQRRRLSIRRSTQESAKSEIRRTIKQISSGRVHKRSLTGTSMKLNHQDVNDVKTLENNPKHVKNTYNKIKSSYKKVFLGMLMALTIGSVYFLDNYFK